MIVEITIVREIEVYKRINHVLIHVIFFNTIQYEF